MSHWAGQSWFVTGASTGFGRAFVEAAWAGGGRVIATARHADALDYLDETDGRVLKLRLDVTQQDQIDEAVAATQAFGGFDVLVNNASYGFLGGVEWAGVARHGARYRKIHCLAPECFCPN